MNIKIFLIFFQLFLFNSPSIAQYFFGFSISHQDSNSIHYYSKEYKPNYNQKLVCVFTSNKIGYAKPLYSKKFDSSYYYRNFDIPAPLNFDSTLHLENLNGKEIDSEILIMAFQIPWLIDNYKFTPLNISGLNLVDKYLKDIIDREMIECLNMVKGLSGFILEISDKNNKLILYDVNVSASCIPEATRFVFFLKDDKIQKSFKVF